MNPPETSQYTGDMCSILFQSQGPLIIPRTILKKCPKLAVRLDKKHIFSKPLDTVDIEDYPLSVGHIIINYLFTDKYECLKPQGPTEDERNCSELATAFRAHAAAVDLELPGLQLFASSEMRRLEEKLSLVLITRTLNDTDLPLNLYPNITANFVSCIIRVSASPSKERKDEMTNQLGVPENVAMVLVKCFLQSKGIKFTESHANETGLKDEKAIDTSQLAQEECELLKILQTVDKEKSQIYQSTFETGVREKMARETVTKAILETWEAGGGSLSSLQHARLQELQDFSVKLSEDLDTCKTDLETSKRRSQRLAIEGKAILEGLALEHEIQGILERQKRQNGFLSLSDRLRLRAAQSRSNDLIPEVSADPVVDPNGKSPKLVNPEQEEEDQTDDDGSTTPVLPACYERDPYSSDVKSVKTLDELLACMRKDIKNSKFETTDTSGQSTPSSTSSTGREFYENYSQPS